jgi:hypothetical protein
VTSSGKATSMVRPSSRSATTFFISMEVMVPSPRPCSMATARFSGSTVVRQIASQNLSMRSFLQLLGTYV